MNLDEDISKVSAFNHYVRQGSQHQIGTDYVDAVDRIIAAAQDKWVKPEYPPYPNNPPKDNGALLRFGIKWNGPTNPLSVPMEDGYWTPWHLAAAHCTVREISTDAFDEWMSERWNEYSRAGLDDENAPNYEPHKAIEEFISDFQEEYPNGLRIVKGEKA